MRRIRPLLAFLVLPILASSALADAEARALVDRIVRSAASLEGGLHDVPDPTAEVNALLALPADQVFAALSDALDLCREPESLAAAHRPYLRDLALLVAGKPDPDRRRKGPLCLWEADGCVLVRGLLYPSDGPRPPCALFEIVGKEPKLRPALEPDGEALLARLLDLSPDWERLLADPAFRRSVGIALGVAGDADAGLAERIAEAAGRRGYPPPDETAAHVAFTLCAGLGRCGDAELLAARIRAAAKLDERESRTAHLTALVEAIHETRDWFDLAALSVELEESAPDASALLLEPVERLQRGIGALGGDPSPDEVRRLWPLVFSASGRLKERAARRVSEFAMGLAESGDPELASLGRDLLVALLWPDWSGRLEAAFAREGVPPTSLSVDAVGAWPDPFRAAEEVFDGEFGAWWPPEPECRFPPPTIYDGVAASPLATSLPYVLSADPAEGVSVTARRLPGFVRITVRNLSEASLHISRYAFLVATGRRLSVRRNRGGEERSWKELRLTFGTAAGGSAPYVYPELDEFHVVPPGGARTYTHPLGADLEPDRRLFVDLFDAAADYPDDELEPVRPRLKSFTGVEAVRPEPALSPADRRARELVDTLTLAQGYFVGRATDIDFTGPTNELIALGPDAVARAIRDALDLACVKGSLPDERLYQLLSLAALLYPGGPSSVPLEDEENRGGLFVVAGHVVHVQILEAGGFGWSPPWAYPPSLEDVAGASPKLRPLLEPDPHALLRALLDPDEQLTGWLASEEARASIGRALGEAARVDDELAARILTELGARKAGASESAQTRVFWTLARAAARLDSAEAESALLDAVESIARASGEASWANARDLSVAIRRGRDPDERLAAARARLGGSDADRYTLLCFEGDGTMREKIAVAREGRDPASFRELAYAIEAGSHPTPVAPDTLLSALDLALGFADEEKPQLRGAAEAVLHAVIWACHGDTIRSSSGSSWTSPDGVTSNRGSRIENGAMLGGWPDPFRAARVNREAIRDGTLSIGGRGFDGLSLFETGGRWFAGGGEDGDEPPPFVVLRAKRETGRLRVTVTNEGEDPVCLIPIDFRAAVADVVRIVSKKDGEIREWTEVRLEFGRWTGLFWYPTSVDASHVRLLRRGETAEFTHPLPTDLDPETRILVSYLTGTHVRGPLPAPLVTRLEATVAK